jgi:hypothetical protein
MRKVFKKIPDYPRLSALYYSVNKGEEKIYMNQFQKIIKSIFLNLTLVLAFLIVFIVTIPSKAFCFYDRFESEFIDLTKWEENDHSVREIKNGKLRMNEYGTTRRFSTYLHLTTPVTGYLESKITLQSGSLVLGDGTGYARIGAYFYNSERGPGSYNAYEGNVWGDVRIVLESDNSLTAKATLWKSTAPDQSAGPVILDQEFAKSIDYDTEYTVSMELSGSQLIFRCGDEEIIYQIQTPVYAPYNPYHHLCTRIYPEAGSAVSVKALFDDVSVAKGALYDSFETPFIDPTKWEESDHRVREISDGKLRMNEYGTTRRFSTYLSLTNPITRYLESKITLQSGSLVLGDGTGYARIGAYFYNSERRPGSYNAYEGNVWSDVQIVLENDNTLKGKAKLWKSTAFDQSAGEYLLDQEFATSINFDTEYTVSMELSGSQLIFRCGDEEIIYQIKTPVYMPYAPYQHLTTRIYPEEGSAVSVKALFDDVKIEKAVKAMSWIPLLLVD